MTSPQPRRPRRRRKLIIFVVVLVIVCCGGIAVGGGSLYTVVRNANQPAKDGAAAFLDHLAAGQTDAAYQSLCAKTRGQFSSDQFAQVVNGRPRLSGYSITSTDVNFNNGNLSASVDARLTYADGSSESHSLPMTQENGGWHVCGQPY
jgi:hypothetical protein